MKTEKKAGEKPISIVKNNGLVRLYCRDCGWYFWGISPEVVERYPIASKALVEMAIILLSPLQRHDK